MRKLILAFLICTSMSAFAQKTNFSGSWQLDTAKTVFGEAPKTIIPEKITVDQQSDKLLLGRINVNEQQQEQPAVAETLLFDGTPFQRTTGDSQVSTMLHWPSDTSFVLTRDGILKATETWTLADNGKTLVIDRSVEQKSNGFKYTIKCYYNRQ